MKFIVAALVSIVVILLVVVGLLRLRSEQLDLAAAAIKSEQPAVAIEILVPLARIGDRSAQRLLATMYAFGWGVRYDDGRAIYWFHQAERGRSSETVTADEFGIGRALYRGEGVKRDEDRGLIWVRRAAMQGDKDAIVFLEKVQGPNKSHP